MKKIIASLLGILIAATAFAASPLKLNQILPTLSPGVVGNGVMISDGTGTHTASTTVGSNGQCLTISGGLPSWGACGGGSASPADPNRSIQFNNSSVFGGDSGFLFNSDGTVHLSDPNGSVVVGNGITLSGDQAVSYGVNNTATGDQSVSIGYGNTTNRLNSIAIGFNNSAPGTNGNGVAIGYSNTADDNSGLVAVAMGVGNSSLGENGVAIGHNNTVVSSGFDSVAMGRGNTANAEDGIAIGAFNNAAAVPSLAFGTENTVNNTFGIAYGWQNTINADNASAWGRNVVNSIAGSLMIGPDNAAKATILSTGEFQAPFFTATSTATSTFNGPIVDIATTTSPCFTNDGVTCITGGGGATTSPASPDRSIQFANAGFFDGDSGLLFNSDGTVYLKNSSGNVIIGDNGNVGNTDDVIYGVNNVDNSTLGGGQNVMVGLGNTVNIFGTGTNDHLTIVGHNNDFGESEENSVILGDNNNIHSARSVYIGRGLSSLNDDVIVFGLSDDTKATYYLGKLAVAGISHDLVYPSAYIETKQGDGSTSTAAIKIHSGTLLNTKEDGTVESDGTHIYWTDDSASRWQLDQQGGGGGTIGGTISPMQMAFGDTATDTIIGTDDLQWLGHTLSISDSHAVGPGGSSILLNINNTTDVASSSGIVAYGAGIGSNATGYSDNVGLSASANNANFLNIGVEGSANTNTTGTNIGVEGSANNSGNPARGIFGSAPAATDSWAGYFDNNVYVGNQIQIAGGTPAAGSVLQSDATGLATWVATSTLGISGAGLQEVSGTLTRAAGAAASSTQAVTGLGGTPRIIYFISKLDSHDDASSNGWADATNQASTRTLMSLGTFGDLTYPIYGETDTGDGWRATLASMDGDGFTLDWDKIGTGQDITVKYVALF